MLSYEIIFLIENLGINSPRFPPVGRLPSSGSKDMVYNQMDPNYLMNRNYPESMLATRSNTSKPILPPLESNGKKQPKHMAAKNRKKMII